MADRSGQKFIDSAAAEDGDSGVVALAVRQDTLVGLATDGKYTPLFVDANGALYVTMSGSITVGSLDGEAAHDAVASAVKPVLVGGYSSAAAPTSVSADGDATNLWMLRNGSAAITVTAAGALIGGDATNGLDVDITRINASATGGATPGMLISAASTNATVIKASAGTLYSLVVTNINAAVRYIKFYNKATTPDENDTPVQVVAVPGATTGGGFTVPIPACGIAFGTGIAFRLVTGVANNDTGAVSANEHTVSYSYK